MAAVLAIVERLLGILLQVFGLTELVRRQTQDAAQEHSAYLIEGIVTTAGLSIANPTYGLAALETRLDSIDAAIAALNAPVLGAIAALPAGSAIVIPQPSDNAAGVWDHVMQEIPGSGPTADKALSDAWRLFNFFNLYGSVTSTAAPDFIVSFGNTQGWTWPTGYSQPMPDYTDIQPSDTVVSWLNRTDSSGHTWFLGADGRHAEAYGDQTGEYFDRIICSLSDVQLQARAAGVGAPIWPGIAGVTLGTTVPAVKSTVLELPMDGIIWLTTSYPPARARWGAAPYYSVYHTGRLAFITDNGDLEPFQYMGWQNAIFVPQTMGRAAGVVVFLEGNIEGAITPWDISV